MKYDTIITQKIDRKEYNFSKGDKMKFNIFKYEFKKSKYPIMKIAFLLLLCFSFISIITISYLNRYEMYVPKYSAPLAEVSINVTLKHKLDKGLFVCLGGDCTTFNSDNFNNVNTALFAVNDFHYYNKKSSKILLSSIFDTDKLKNSIESINLHVGTRDYYYDSDTIKNFQVAKLRVAFDDKDIAKKEYYDALLLPQIATNNYKGIYNQISCAFLSLFYNWKYFIVPYFWLFIAFLLYIYKKDEINIDLKLPNSSKAYYIAFGLIALIAVLLRLNLFNYYPLWIDEIYTKTNAIISLKGCFSDPGNPPLFYILELIFTKIFGTSNIALRFLPLVFGCLVPYVIYLIFRENTESNKNNFLALFAFFFASINTVLIYHSSEARSYSLSMLLSALMVYFLFRYLENYKKKDFICYISAAFLAVNTYFYLTVLAFVNFIWGVVSLVEDKKINEIKNFIIANVLVFVSFLPYVIYTFKNSVEKDFNSWIAPLTKDNLIYMMEEFFSNKYIFIILCVVLVIHLILNCLPEKLLSKINLEKDEKRENLFIYLVYALCFTFIILSVVSIAIKPILHKRLLLSLYSLFFMLQIISITTTFNFKKIENKMINGLKIFKVVYCSILLLLCFAITKPMNLKDVYRIDPYMHFLLNDSKAYNAKNYEVHAIVAAKEEYLTHFLNKDDYKYIHWHFTDTTSGNTDLNKVDKEEYVKADINAVFYVSSLAADVGISSFFKSNYYPYVSNTYPNNYTKIIFDKSVKK